MSDKRKMLLGYVQEVEPSIVQHFVEKAPAQVVDAMQHSVSNMLGTLPPAFFNVTINTHGENLAQLMFSVLMTGYLMSNAQARLQLTQSLALPSGMLLFGRRHVCYNKMAYTTHPTTPLPYR